MEVICDKREVSEARAGYVYNCRFVKPEKRWCKIGGPWTFLCCCSDATRQCFDRLEFSILSSCRLDYT